MYICMYAFVYLGVELVVQLACGAFPAYMYMYMWVHAHMCVCIYVCMYTLKF